VDCLVASIAVHDFVNVVRQATDKARLPCFDGKELVIVDDYCWVQLRLLYLILHGIAADDRAVDNLAKLHHVELRSTYWTAVGTFDPWR
jgi:hypothetical protein